MPQACLLMSSFWAVSEKKSFETFSAHIPVLKKFKSFIEIFEQVEKV